MRETQMFEEIWKEFQREISEEQAFSLSLLMAFFLALRRMAG